MADLPNTIYSIHSMLSHSFSRIKKIELHLFKITKYLSGCQPNDGKPSNDSVSFYKPSIAQDIIIHHNDNITKKLDNASPINPSFTNFSQDSPSFVQDINSDEKTLSNAGKKECKDKQAIYLSNSQTGLKSTRCNCIPVINPIELNTFYDAGVQTAYELLCGIGDGVGAKLLRLERKVGTLFFVLYDNENMEEILGDEYGDEIYEMGIYNDRTNERYFLVQKSIYDIFKKIDSSKINKPRRE